MILQSLVKLYEILEEQKKVTGLGWSLAKISFRIMLNKDGELVGLVKDLQELSLNFYVILPVIFSG